MAEICDLARQNRFSPHRNSDIFDWVPEVRILAGGRRWDGCCGHKGVQGGCNKDVKSWLFLFYALLFLFLTNREYMQNKMKFYNTVVKPPRYYITQLGEFWRREQKMRHALRCNKQKRYSPTRRGRAHTIILPEEI